MTDETIANGTDETADTSSTPPMPLVVNVQYVKDLSFENPNAPRSLMAGNEAPKIDLSVDLQGQSLGENVAEVQLRLRAEATVGDATAFIAELVYCGVFTLPPLPQDQQRAVLLIEGPRLLFPFARQIIADVTAQGGFPPLLLQPLDFVELYRRQVLGQGMDTQGNA
ncbi:protein-export chaperone SecB [Niveispirillum irakense]|uniref:protein-export chaperone SecB n=1 Tax=Niveispirillum irakense TaxID=34011 RepID=UPI000401E23E|nr:protein-export chaperone SecB [Niveispirillum irakense]